MSKYLLCFLCLFLLASCSDTSISNSLTEPDKNSIESVSPVITPTTLSTISIADSLAIEKARRAQKEQYATFMQTTLVDCDSPEFKKTNEAILQAQRTASGRLAIVLGSAPERCKIRAIIRDNLSCSLLTESKSIERCEYAKKAVQEMNDFREKQAVYERLFGSMNQPNGKQLQPTLFSDWW